MQRPRSGRTVAAQGPQRCGGCWAESCCFGSRRSGCLYRSSPGPLDLPTFGKGGMGDLRNRNGGSARTQWFAMFPRSRTCAALDPCPASQRSTEFFSHKRSGAPDSASEMGDAFLVHGCWNAGWERSRKTGLSFGDRLSIWNSTCFLGSFGNRFGRPLVKGVAANLFRLADEFDCPDSLALPDGSWDVFRWNPGQS